MRLFRRLLNRNGNRDRHADHRVVAGADQTHHFNMSRNGGGARELRVRMHSSHRIRHAVGSGASRHIVGMKRSSRSTAR